MGKASKITVITGTRADFGLYYPILEEFRKDKSISLSLIVTGMHLSKVFGSTYKEIEDKGFKINSKVKILMNRNTLGSQSKELGKAVIGITTELEKLLPDYIMVLGDRGEMLAASIAAIHLGIKIIHLHGGEVSGTVDNQIRQMISQVADIHFVSCKSAKANLQSMGICRNLFIVGAPGLDYIKSDLISRKKVLEYLGLEKDDKYLIFIQHPITEEYSQIKKHIMESIKALRKIPNKKIILLPNSDAGRAILRKSIMKLKRNKDIKIIKNLEHRLYLSALRGSECLIGNSSSGIIESTLFKIPVINIGNRQIGRQRAGNVIDAGYSSTEILRAWDKITSRSFQEKLKRFKSPYYFGGASKKILKIFKRITRDG